MGNEFQLISTDAQRALEEQFAYASLVNAELLQALRKNGLSIVFPVHLWFCEGFWIDPKNSGCLVATDTQQVWDRYDIYPGTVKIHNDLGVMSVLCNSSNIAIYRLEREVTDARQVVIGSRYQP